MSVPDGETTVALLARNRSPGGDSAATRLALLQGLLDGGLEFHSEDSSYCTHDIHAFAAKFPPQLPSLFIRSLTAPGEAVLDPMMGSGTAVVEAFLSGRNAIGFDIDPLAVKLCRVKTTPLQEDGLLERLASNVVASAVDLMGKPEVERALAARTDSKTRAFIDYWFLPRTQLELMSLLLSIDLTVSTIEDTTVRETMREFLQIAFSSIIITKSGGVSRARDLAHTRPHLQTDKVPRNAIEQFRIRVKNNIKSLRDLNSSSSATPLLQHGDARNLGGLVSDASVRLIITSPPYANAIDYMRAHKFSLVWLGWGIEELSERRSTYIGSERTGGIQRTDTLPVDVEDLVAKVGQKDRKQGKVLRKYFLDMRDVLLEINRVLMPDSAAVLVVGSSTMRDIVVDTARCLCSIASSVQPPFIVGGIGHRRLDRNRRMMPVRNGTVPGSGIEQRMHTEDIIGLYKPSLA